MVATVDDNFGLKPNLRPNFEALAAKLRLKEGQLLPPAAIGVSSSIAKGMAASLLHSSGLPYVPFCDKWLLLLMEILG